MLSWKLPLPPAAVGATLAVSYKGTGPMNVFLVWALQFYVFYTVCGNFFSYKKCVNCVKSYSTYIFLGLKHRDEII